MPKQRMYEVTIRELRIGTVLVAANSEREARRAAEERYDNGDVVMEDWGTDVTEWDVEDHGEDPGQ